MSSISFVPKSNGKLKFTAENNGRFSVKASTARFARAEFLLPQQQEKCNLRGTRNRDFIQWRARSLVNIERQRPVDFFRTILRCNACNESAVSQSSPSPIYFRPGESSLGVNINRLDSFSFYLRIHSRRVQAE